MNRRIDENHSVSPLLSADIDEILDKYGDILQSYVNLREKNSIYASYKQTDKKLDILFPFKEHPIHGITGLHATEKYDENGHVKEYHYQWKRIIPKQGVKYSHISAWENERHNKPDTPEKFIVETDPHHHHIPGDRSQRKENYHYRTLDAVFNFVAHYIRSGEEYKP